MSAATYRVRPGILPSDSAASGGSAAKVYLIYSLPLLNQVGAPSAPRIFPALHARKMAAHPCAARETPITRSSLNDPPALGVQNIGQRIDAINCTTEAFGLYGLDYEVNDCPTRVCFHPCLAGQYIDLVSGQCTCDVGK